MVIFGLQVWFGWMGLGFGRIIGIVLMVGFGFWEEEMVVVMVYWLMDGGDDMDLGFRKEKCNV